MKPYLLQKPNTSHAHTARTTVWVQLVVVNATFNSKWIISLLKIGFLLMGLITIRYNTYYLPPIGMAAFIILYVCFLIISFKLYIAVFATTLIIMQNYRQKSIPPNILILFKKKRFSKEKTLRRVGSGLKFFMIIF